MKQNWPDEIGFYWCKHKFKPEDEPRVGVCEVKQGGAGLIYIFKGHFIYRSESLVEFGKKIEPDFT